MSAVRLERTRYYVESRRYAETPHLDLDAIAALAELEQAEAVIAAARNVASLHKEHEPGWHGERENEGFDYFIDLDDALAAFGSGEGDTT